MKAATKKRLGKIRKHIVKFRRELKEVDQFLENLTKECDYLESLIEDFKAALENESY